MKLSLAKLNLLRVTLASAALSLLASCGGGDQIEKFVPDRIVVFGDESGLIEPDAGFPSDGRKYTVNGVERDATTGLPIANTRDCTRNPIWVQVLANDYGYQFADCLTHATTARAFTFAQVSSTVTMMNARITNYLTTTGFNAQDLVAIMVGTHDVVAAASAADPLAAATAAGTAVGTEVVRITDRGARVIVSTIPDVAYTPYGRGRSLTEQVLLSNLTRSFNDALRRRLQDVRGGGHSVGLVLGDELVLLMVRSPGSYGLVNVADAICGATALTSCDENSVATSSPTSYGADWLWAGSLQPGANAQSRLGSAAVYRARNNPF
ncbi:hypothetical protein [Piscinibacter gummiphilus]|uniref:Esterase n=1 Tax=Piscinibacter gummiphilus TaxID=946333 RepID=A0ABZ0CS65_9BURK|nr:hypothetical protein [Piscinibacter gummiphilus]WOB07835.1 hypothetical protein RXV79_23375 [Piscinibacter gummiphilus]